jgi:hypothetical protein
LENPNSNGMDIKEALELNPRRFDNEIEDLIELGLLSVCKQPSMNRPGAKGYKFVLSNEIKQGLAELR